MTTEKSFCAGFRTVTMYLTIAMALMVAGRSASAQTESAVFKLQGALDGGDPEGGLIADSAGNLYGTTTVGGPGSFGTVFEISPPFSGGAWTETTLHAFSGAPDGNWPVGPLTMDKAGNLYGTTQYGGLAAPYNDGIVFELSPPAVAGDPWSETILHTFTGGTDGHTPNGGLVIDAAGNLYGTTIYGGACGWGTVFELSPPATVGGPWTDQVIHAFRYTCNNKTYNDGGIPAAGLLMGADGSLFGTTDVGGATYDGTVFRLRPPAAGQTTWTEKVIYTFTGGSDGRNPTGSLVSYRGNLYGTTNYGANSACNFGIPGCGSIFELSPPSTAGGPWTETTIYSFTGGTDGANPEWSVLFDGQGNLYTSSGSGGNTGCGNVGCGAVIKLSPPAAGVGAWTETTLYDFSGRGDGGGSPSGLTVGESYHLYGTTYVGGDGTCSYYGNTGCGVVFRIIP